jgi:putative flavoprotein involved in K+ transport
VRNIIWATGFEPRYGWVELPIFDEQGRPCHRRGVTEVPGAYFLGLSWMWTRGSALMGWVGRDAAYLAQHIDAHALQHTAQPVAVESTLPTR